MNLTIFTFGNTQNKVAVPMRIRERSGSISSSRRVISSQKNIGRVDSSVRAQFPLLRNRRHESRDLWKTLSMTGVLTSANGFAAATCVGIALVRRELQRLSSTQAQTARSRLNQNLLRFPRGSLSKVFRAQRSFCTRPMIACRNCIKHSSVRQFCQ